MGGTGAGAYSTLYPVMINNLLGTKFKLIAGYKGTAEINVALERGEVEGRAGVALCHDPASSGRSGCATARSTSSSRSGSSAPGNSPTCRC